MALDREPVRRRGLAWALLSCASFMAIVDITIVTIALPSIGEDLGFSSGNVQWILSSYSLTFGGFLLFMGRAGDLIGRRFMMLTGLALFGIASLVGGLSLSPSMLIVARFLQGIGGAALVPASLALIASIFPEGEERNRALGFSSVIGGVGFVFGMVGGGIITELMGWRWVLFLNVPVALGVIVLTAVVIAESKDADARRTLDLSGAVSITSGLTALIYAISELPEAGWTSPWHLGIGSVGVLLLGIFVVVERRASAPLVPLSMFRARVVAVPNASVILLSIVGASQLYVLTLFLQNGLGYTPLETGFLFVPMTLAAIAGSAAAGRVTTRLGARRTAMIGLTLSGAGLLLVASQMSAGNSLPVIIVGMIVAEAGFVVASVPLTIIAIGASAEADRGLASGVLSTSRELGNVFGWVMVAAVLVIAGASSSGEGNPGALIDGLRFGALAAILCAALALVLLTRLPTGEDIASR